MFIDVFVCRLSFVVVRVVVCELWFVSCAGCGLWVVCWLVVLLLLLLLLGYIVLKE